jgi:hypothetical protein
MGMRQAPRRRDLRPSLLAALALTAGLRAGAAVPVAAPLGVWAAAPAPVAPVRTSGGLAHAAFAVG